MKQNITVKSYILAAAAAFGLVASASAQSANVAPSNPAETSSVAGLLGARYAQVDATYYDLTGGNPGVARGLAFTYNQPFNSYVDFGGTYSIAQAQVSGAHVDQEELDLGATAYSTMSWGKPFAMADVGWVWAHSHAASDDSFVYKLGTGVEFQAMPNLTVAPFVTFVRATSFNQSEFDGGVKAAYRFTRDWSATARVQYDWIRHDKDTVEYSLGANYRF